MKSKITIRQKERERGDIVVTIVTSPGVRFEGVEASVWQITARLILC